MKLGILSDTHGNVRNTRCAMEIFRREGVQEIIHCGDVGSWEVVKILSEVPCHYVFGNTDMPSTIRNAILAENQNCYEYVGMIQREGIRIAFLHGHDWKTFDELLESRRFDLICTGHTHEYHWMVDGDTRLLNPGALDRTPSPSVVILTLPELQINLKKLKLEF